MNPVTLVFVLVCGACVFSLAERLGGSRDVAFLLVAAVASFLAASTDLFNDPRD